MTMLKYKAEQEGKVDLEIERFFPSSKTCYHCLNVVDSLPLDIRLWTCPSCGTKQGSALGAFLCKQYETSMPPSISEMKVCELFPQELGIKLTAQM